MQSTTCETDEGGDALVKLWFTSGLQAPEISYAQARKPPGQARRSLRNVFEAATPPPLRRWGEFRRIAVSGEFLW